MNLEMRYRRLLRTLPRAYRSVWEEDMVTSLRDSGVLESGRLPLGERLAVLGLAVRLRFTGAHASPRVMVWHRAAHSLALMSGLALAGIATANLVSTVDVNSVPAWWELGYDSLWVATFFCLVFGRNILARVLVTLAAGALLGSMIVRYAPDGALAADPALIGGSVVLAVVPALLVALTPHDAKPSKRFWLPAYALAVLLSVPGGALPSAYVDPFNIIALATEVAAIVALFARPRAPHRLIALGFAVGVVGLLHLSGMAGYLPSLMIAGPLAVACLVVALVDLRRLDQSAATG